MNAAPAGADSVTVVTRRTVTVPESIDLKRTVGGLKEKILAAHRAGIRRVILPDRNKADLEEVPPEVRDELEFVPVNHLEEGLSNALETMPEPSAAYVEQVAKKESAARPPTSSN